MCDSVEMLLFKGLVQFVAKSTFNSCDRSLHSFFQSVNIIVTVSAVDAFEEGRVSQDLYYVFSCLSLT